MRRLLVSIVASIGFLPLTSSLAHAQYSGSSGSRSSAGSMQYYNMSQGPRLSPYLNMLRGGNPAANYYLGVVPERERRANDNYYQSGLMQLEQRQLSSGGNIDLEDELPRLPGTGHGTAFLMYSPYYNMPSPGRFQTAPIQRTTPSQRVR